MGTVVDDHLEYQFGLLGLVLGWDRRGQGEVEDVLEGILGQDRRVRQRG